MELGTIVEITGGILAIGGGTIAAVKWWGAIPYRLDNVELACAQSAKKNDIERLEKTVNDNGVRTTFILERVNQSISHLEERFNTSIQQTAERFETENIRLNGINSKIARIEGQLEVK